MVIQKLVAPTSWLLDCTVKGYLFPFVDRQRMQCEVFKQYCGAAINLRACEVITDMTRLVEIRILNLFMIHLIPLMALACLLYQRK